MVGEDIGDVPHRESSSEDGLDNVATGELIDKWRGEGWGLE